MYTANTTCRLPQNHPFSFMLKITPSTIRGRKNTVSNTPQIVKLPFSLLVIISIVLIIYLNIRINNIVGNFILSYFPEGGKETGKRTGLNRVTRRVSKRVSRSGNRTGYKRVARTGFLLTLCIICLQEQVPNGYRNRVSPYTIYNRLFLYRKKSNKETQSPHFSLLYFTVPLFFSYTSYILYSTFSYLVLYVFILFVWFYYSLCLTKVINLLLCFSAVLSMSLQVSLYVYTYV